ncbi:cysteine hydrolase [Acrocarpospora pleiomorpha]|uniref:Cysteine hydrolase n=1 Tax=Acrocarpospora pleiomorpha TaxID=90975 RepID=A0A5M3XTN7_9ACTN|nr:cysteine hydrolase [Acrocarpospora pleiomorpha]GES24240.1 cysteine hydrolase [Acrocarpospora pleiomorpha]
MTDKTALIVIDMQNGFCLHPAGGLQQKMGWPPLVNVPAVIDASAALIAAARQRGIPVIYVRYRTLPDMLNAMRIHREAASVLPPGTVLSMEGAEGDIVERLAPLPGDYMVSKTRWDAFLYTDLEPLLQGLGTVNLIMCGVLTNACVETTARSALQRNYRVWVARDCVTSESAQLHENALMSMTSLGANVTDWRDAIAGRVLI